MAKLTIQVGDKPQVIEPDTLYFVREEKHSSNNSLYGYMSGNDGESIIPRVDPAILNVKSGHSLVSMSYNEVYITNYAFEHQYVLSTSVGKARQFGRKVIIEIPYGETELELTIDATTSTGDSPITSTAVYTFNVENPAIKVPELVLPRPEDDDIDGVETVLYYSSREFDWTNVA